MVRQEVSDYSLGHLMSRTLPLARDVRADRDGVRTFFAVDDIRIKFEILLEARIDLTGELDSDLRVPVLDIEHAIAEKFLANTDRGLDDSTLSRDLIDLAFVATRVGKDRTRAKRCIEALAIADTATLRKEIRILRAMPA